MRFTAGQFTELRLPHQNVDDRGDKRWFTISSSPNEPLVSITTKFSPEHSSSFKQALRDLRPGSAVQLAEAMGDFVLPKDHSLPLVFIAGGIGITPMHSMVSYLRAVQEQRTITLLYMVNDRQELAFEETFTSYPMQFIPHVGRLTAAEIVAITKPTATSLVYISGPEPMVESLFSELQSTGLPAHQLIGDYFPGYPTLR